MATQTVEIEEDPKLQKELVSLLVHGLTSHPRWIPSLFLWDEKGLQLFEKITRSEYYYPFRAETDVLSQNIGGLLDVVQDNSVILELGSGYVSNSIQ
jgi:uncharacterized SAM-dependent methyltransferase